MNLLVTPAITLNCEQQQILSKTNNLFFIESEIVNVDKLNLDFSLSIIDGIVCNYFFTANDLCVLPNLKFIQLTSAGLDRVNVHEIKEKSIALFNAGSIYSVPIAEWVICQILAVYKKADYFFEIQKQHLWKKERNLKELSGSTATIIGYGNIGRAVAKRLKAFDVTVYAVDIHYPINDVFFDEYYSLSQLKEAIRTSDIIILSAPFL